MPLRKPVFHHSTPVTGRGGGGGSFTARETPPPHPTHNLPLAEPEWGAKGGGLPAPPPIWPFLYKSSHALTRSGVHEWV